jgi:hypothetical protein
MLEETTAAAKAAPVISSGETAEVAYRPLTSFYFTKKSKNQFCT